VHEDDVASIVLPCGATTLVVIASWVEAIDELSRAEGEVQDVVALVGVDDSGSLDPRSRRALRVRGGLWLAVGHEVQLREIPARAFGPVPAWLGRIADRAPVASLVELARAPHPEFGFEIDVARLVHGGGAWG
jgi:hypothetical protein